MAHGIKWDGANAAYAPPHGVSEDQCATLHVFRNGACIVSCWELNDEELAEVIRTRKVFQSIWSGTTLYPSFIGSESTVHALVADFGAVWKLNDPLSKLERQVFKTIAVTDGCNICDNELPQIPISLIKTCDRPGCPYKRSL